MVQQMDDCGNSSKSDKNGGCMVTPSENDAMTKEERQEVVLRFMAEHDLAFPPKVLYRNLKLKRGITFRYSTVNNYLEEFVELGFVRRVYPQPLEAGEIKDVPDGDSDDVRANYIITDAGREAAESGM